MADAVTRVFEVERLRVHVYPDRLTMGRAAALFVAERMRSLARSRGEVRMVFAAAPSQDAFLRTLVGLADLPWPRVVAFHMDEYVGLPPGAPQHFGRWLRERLFDRVPLKEVHYLDPAPADVQAECARYARLVGAAPIDVACLGIGENGHLAFNDPPVADFDDPHTVKVVALDEACRRQQVHDGAFADLDAVPTHALTLTIPALMAAACCSVVVPGTAKADAVAAALWGPVTTACPAAILRRHPDATLHLDPAAAHLVQARLDT